MNSASRRCSCQTKAGEPCRAWAMRGSDPPVCLAHAMTAAERARSAGKETAQGTAGAPDMGATGATAGAADEGFYPRNPAEVNIDQAIAGLIDKMKRLDQLISAADCSQVLDGLDGASLARLVRMLELYAQGSSRLARLLRDRKSLADETGDRIHESLVAAYEELRDKWGIRF